MSDGGSGGVERIKLYALKGIAASDVFREKLVLKGGNAIDLAYGLGARASIDLDFSMADDFDDVDEVKSALEANLNSSFAEIELLVFDLTIEPKPHRLSEEIADFWGGYKVGFKLLENKLATSLEPSLEQWRRRAASVTPLGGKTFKVDISKYEYCECKELCDQDGFTYFVYSLPMIAAEKLRAICQQMPQYAPIVHRSRPGAPRARDFLDLHGLVSAGYVNPSSSAFHELIRKVFAAKRVPLPLMGEIGKFREFHRSDFQSVLDTVDPEEEIEDFDFYFDFVLTVVRHLKALWNV